MNAGGNETRGKAATNVNPFQPPDTQIESEADSLGVDWRLFTYTLVGFAIGTALVAPLVLAVNPFDRQVVGAAIGGPIGAILGFAYGERRRKAENFNGRKRVTSLGFARTATIRDVSDSRRRGLVVFCRRTAERLDRRDVQQ